MTHPFLPDRPVDEQRSHAELARGGIPLRAQRRIHELHHSARPITTSTLSTSETVVARATGLTPISQVMGSSVFHVGFRGFATWAGGELVPLTAAYDRARALALSRMQQEGAAARRALVIDTRFLGRGYAWGEDLIEFTAVGTAVRIDGQPPPPLPALTLLTADELYKLHRAGYWPVAIAMGNCFFYARHADCVSEGQLVLLRAPRPHERLAGGARSRGAPLRAFAAHFGAHGVVGVKVERNARDHEYESNDRSHTAFSLDLVVMGTAVVRRGDGPHKGAEPLPARPSSSISAIGPVRYGKHGVGKSWPTKPSPGPAPGAPQHAAERIQRMRGAQGQRFFTSDLSVKEFLLVREAGFECAGS